ncbi:MAG: SDR family NAD(P)-dependent oxidoreductase, partial [Bradyrhizobium sp.]
GIGAAAARALAASGHDVAINWLDDEAQAATVAAEIRATGRRAALIQGDVGTAASAAALVEKTLAAFGRIDVLVNNAGIFPRVEFLDMAEAEWDRVFAVNLKSAYLSMKHVIPVMIKQGGGSIINISSIASIRHVGISYVSYNASKAAMNQMTRSTAVEFASRHVRV